jgi:dihydroneopterin aldolase
MIQPIGSVALSSRLVRSKHSPRLPQGSSRLAGMAGTRRAAQHVTGLRLRSARVSDIVLPVEIHHAWLPERERIEGSEYSFEELRVSIEVRFVAASENPTDFNGLFNYAVVIHDIREMAGQRLESPIESIADTILAALRASADKQRVPLTSAWVQVLRPALTGLTIAIESTYVAGAA